MPLSYFTGNEQWILETPAKVSIVTLNNTYLDNLPIYAAHLVLRRRPRFYCMVLIFPSLALYALSTLAFLIPIDSDEKTSFPVTLLLAQIFNFATLIDLLPASSLHFPIIAQLVLTVVVHMAVNCCLSILGMKF